MNKGIDLIQRQQIEAIDGYPTGNVYVGLTFEELAELEKELKAIEIIKCDGLDLINLIKSKTVEEYNRIRYKKYNELTPDGYSLLKEVLS